MWGARPASGGGRSAGVREPPPGVTRGQQTRPPTTEMAQQTRPQTTAAAQQTRPAPAERVASPARPAEEDAPPSMQVEGPAPPPPVDRAGRGEEGRRRAERRQEALRRQERRSARIEEGRGRAGRPMPRLDSEDAVMPTGPGRGEVQDELREQMVDPPRWEDDALLPWAGEYENPWVENDYPAIDMEGRQEEQPAIEMQDQPYPLTNEAPLPLEMEHGLINEERAMERAGWQVHLNFPLPRGVYDELPTLHPVVEFPSSDPEEEPRSLQHEGRLPLQHDERLPVQNEERPLLQQDERLPLGWEGVEEQPLLQQDERLPLEWEGVPREDSSEGEEAQEGPSRLRPRPVVHPADLGWIQARKRRYEEDSSEEDRQRRAGRRGMTEEEVEEMLLHVGGVETSYRERQSQESLNQQQEWIREMKNRLRRVNHQC